MRWMRFSGSKTAAFPLTQTTGFLALRRYAAAAFSASSAGGMLFSPSGSRRPLPFRGK